MAIRYFGPYSWSFHPVLKYVKKLLPYGKLFNYAGYFHDIEYAKKLDDKTPELRKIADRTLLKDMFSSVRNAKKSILYKIFGYFFAVFYFVIIRVFGVFYYYKNRELQGKDLLWSIEAMKDEIKAKIEEIEKKGEQNIKSMITNSEVDAK